MGWFGYITRNESKDMISTDTYVFIHFRRHRLWVLGIEIFVPNN